VVVVAVEICSSRSSIVHTRVIVSCRSCSSSGSSSSMYVLVPVLLVVLVSCSCSVNSSRIALIVRFQNFCVQMSYCMYICK